jgi:GNAT superfamily N-acetyltransferase
MNIRLMEKRDVEMAIPIARYMHDCSPVYRDIPFLDCAMRTSFFRAIENPKDWFCAVIEHDGEIIGGILAYAAYEVFSDKRTASDQGIFVKEQYRGTRAAFKLVRAFEAWAEAVGCVKISVGVSAGIDNPRAERLYEGLGFREVGKILHKEIR